MFLFILIEFSFNALLASPFELKKLVLATKISTIVIPFSISDNAIAFNKQIYAVGYNIKADDIKAYGTLSGGSISTTGSLSAGSISTSGSLSAGSISTSGSLSAGSISASSISVTGTGAIGKTVSSNYYTGMKIIAGRVDANGSSYGKGFEVTKISDLSYEIKWSTAFSDFPYLTATLQESSTAAARNKVITIINNSAKDKVKLAIYDPNGGAAVSAAFTFIVVGK